MAKLDEIIAGQARIEQKVDDLFGRLLGNGQPGIIQNLYSRVDSVDEKIDVGMQAHSARVSAIETKMVVAEAAHEATSSQKAKFWSITSSVCSFVGGVFADWMLFGRH